MAAFLHRLTPEMQDRRGFTLIELLIVVAIIGVLAAIATPNLLAARMSGNEASAIGSLRSVLSAQADYQNLNRGYADDLAKLATACGGVGAPFLSADLASNGVQKSGYLFSIAASASAVPAPADCNGAPTQTDYYATVIPASVGTTGRRAFAATSASSIWQNTAGAAPSEPFVAGGTVSPLSQ